jgi:hypothetical protein
MTKAKDDAKKKTADTFAKDLAANEAAADAAAAEQDAKVDPTPKAETTPVKATKPAQAEETPPPPVVDPDSEAAQWWAETPDNPIPNDPDNTRFIARKAWRQAQAEKEQQAVIDKAVKTAKESMKVED